MLFALIAIAGVVSGCAPRHKNVSVPSLSDAYPPGTIISSAEKGPVSFGQMIDDLAGARVVYVGETHSRTRDHEIQLRIMKALSRKHPDLCVGMEMFSRPYQPILTQWSAGKLETEVFVQNTHWYANWKFDYPLYADLLAFIRDQQMPLYGLNIAFHLPSKIAAGGIDSLLPEDSARLPAEIDLSVAEHRQYLREVFEGPHHRTRGHITFEHFYQAQCVWEEVMAETIVENRKGRPMLVFAGNGHITHGFGIPDRAFRRDRARFRTVMPVSAGQRKELTAADYLWVTPADNNSPH